MANSQHPFPYRLKEGTKKRLRIVVYLTSVESQDSSLYPVKREYLAEFLFKSDLRETMCSSFSYSTSWWGNEKKIRFVMHTRAVAEARYNSCLPEYLSLTVCKIFPDSLKEFGILFIPFYEAHQVFHPEWCSLGVTQQRCTTVYYFFSPEQTPRWRSILVFSYSHSDFCHI